MQPYMDGKMFQMIYLKLFHIEMFKIIYFSTKMSYLSINAISQDIYDSSEPIILRVKSKVNVGVTISFKSRITFGLLIELYKLFV